MSTDELGSDWEGGAVTESTSELLAFAGLSVAELTIMEDRQLPDPYRELLVHDRDMTPALESFHGDSLHLDVLSKELAGEVLLRLVMLVCDRDEQPVVYGVIRIFLDRFEDGVRALILDCYKPLGAILAQHQVVHTSHPTVFFAIQAKQSICEAFNLDGSQTLYGRQNELLDGAARSLAQVVEILPPMTDRQPQA